MTESELKEWEKLADAATEGPWEDVHPNADDGDIRVQRYHPEKRTVIHAADAVAWKLKAKDAAFIAHSNPERIKRLIAEVRRLKSDYERACKTVAEMHAAAVGEIAGPRLGVVEDVKVLREACFRLREQRDSLRKENAGLRDRDGEVEDLREENAKLREQLGVAEEALGFYSGNFDGREGTRWNGDTIFIETKFGSTEWANDGGRIAREALDKLGESK